MALDLQWDEHQRKYLKESTWQDLLNLHNKDWSEKDDVTDVTVHKDDWQDTNGNRIYTDRDRPESSAGVTIQSAAQEWIPGSFVPQIALSAMIP